MAQPSGRRVTVSSRLRHFMGFGRAAGFLVTRSSTTSRLAVFLAATAFLSPIAWADAPPALANPASAEKNRDGPAIRDIERVITLAPHVTEMVYAAGAGHKLVATVTASNYPPEALAVPRVGDGLSINAEQLLTLQPDLIIGWQETLAIQKLTPLLGSFNIPVMYSEPQQLDDIPDDIERLGSRLGTASVAQSVAGKLREQLAALRKTYAHRTPVSVFIEVGTNPLYTLGADPLTNDAIASCGGVNVFDDVGVVAPAVPAESVLLRNPDVVIIADVRPDRVRRRADSWAGLQLEAARNQHVYGIDPDTLVRPGPRLIDATRQLCEYLDRARQALQ